MRDLKKALCAAVLFSFVSSVASAAAGAEDKSHISKDPRRIVKTVCIDRIMRSDILFGTKWGLDDARVYFSKPIQADIDKYFEQARKLSQKYGKYDLLMSGSDNAWSMLMQGDPITGSWAEPESAKIYRIRYDQSSCQYKVVYRETGNDGEPYDRSITVNLEKDDETWAISEVAYGTPVSHFAHPEGSIRTFSEMLAVLTNLLHETFNWAADHRKELRLRRPVSPSYTPPTPLR